MGRHRPAAPDPGKNLREQGAHIPVRRLGQGSIQVPKPEREARLVGGAVFESAQDSLDVDKGRPR